MTDDRPYRQNTKSTFGGKVEDPKENLCKHGSIDKLDAKVTCQKTLDKLSVNKEKQQ